MHQDANGISITCRNRNVRIVFDFNADIFSSQLFLDAIKKKTIYENSKLLHKHVLCKNILTFIIRNYVS